MNKIALLSLASAAALASATSVQAQTLTPYVGVEIGHHDLGAPNSTPIKSDNGFVGGVIAGVEAPVGESMTLGVEGNYALGTGAIDADYGVAAKLGFNVSEGSQVFVKAGYKWVDTTLTSTTVPAVKAKGTLDDYVVGVGADLGVGVGGGKLRVGVDTVSFDSIRPYAGLIWKF